MKRRDWIIKTGIAGSGILLNSHYGVPDLRGDRSESESVNSDFGRDFKWGVAAAAYQTEGAWNLDGKSESNWDHFSRIKGKIERSENADIAADFYHRYSEDIDLIKAMNFKGEDQ